MSDITDAQNLAIYNASGQALPTALATPVGGTAVVETVVSGTPFQVSKARNANVYIAITTAASVTIQMGPTSAGNTISIAPAESEALGVTSLFVPAGWYVLITGTVADFTVTAVLC